MHSMTEASVSTPSRGESLNGYSLKFHTPGKVSELRLFVYKAQWYLKYRFTYPEWCETDAFSKIEELTRQLPWAVSE